MLYEVITTVAALAQAKADVAVAKANLAAAKINLDYTKVFSPISGRIGKSSVTEGALVTANQETTLAVVQNLDQIYVDVNQSSEELIALKKGLNNPEQNSMVSLFIGKDGIPYDLQGKLLFSDATVDQSTGMVQLRILFPNPEKELLPGLFVRARVAQSRQEKAIVVPQQSVIRNADGSVSVRITSYNVCYTKLLRVALVQVSPPDAHGYCSLGISVDITLSGMRNAQVTIAQVNPQMPRTWGDSLVHIDDIDYLVEYEEELLESLPKTKNKTVVERIGHYVSQLVDDGATLQIGFGHLPHAIMPYLAGKKDLGIHTRITSYNVCYTKLLRFS